MLALFFNSALTVLLALTGLNPTEAPAKVGDCCGCVDCCATGNCKPGCCPCDCAAGCCAKGKPCCKGHGVARPTSARRASSTSTRDGCPCGCTCCDTGACFPGCCPCGCCLEE